MKETSTGGMRRTGSMRCPRGGLLPFKCSSGPRVPHGVGRRREDGPRMEPKLRTAAYSSKVSISEMSGQIKEMRSQIEENEMVASMMAGLRGTNMNDDNFAADDVTMRLIEVHDVNVEDCLPQNYVPDMIANFWGRRPAAVVSRVLQLLAISGGFLGSIAWDIFQDQLKQNEVKRAIELRTILTSLGPAYIKLGQALSIRPDLLSPKAMVELQKLCDKVPSFPSDIAMDVLNSELGKPWQEVFSELTPEPIAAASLGQVYKGKLKTGEPVAVKVQRPYVLETVTIDMYIIRSFGFFLHKFPKITTDVVALLDEWAARFFDELDYVKEGNNGTNFAEGMKKDLPQVVVPKVYHEFTTRRVLTTEWLDGEKLSQSKANDVGKLVNIGVICYLKQLLDTGVFHADPHPGNLIRTPDGRLAILDFGLMTQIDDNIKYGMIEAISHLIHRDYDAIVEDFVTLDFIPEGTDLKPILPVLAKVFDQALEGGGAKNINFQELAADLAQITFDYPFRIPPYFALIIRAIGVLEGIALVGNPEFAIVDEAYPYISKRLLTDDSPRLREALRYMIYGKNGVFDAERLIDLLSAFENFSLASNSARGDLDKHMRIAATLSRSAPSGTSTISEPSTSDGGGDWSPIPIPALIPNGPNNNGRLWPFPMPGMVGDAAAALPSTLSGATGTQMPSNNANIDGSNGVREALRFLFSPEGVLFRDFLMDELVKSIDALSREQLRGLIASLGLERVMVPIPLPFASKPLVPLAPVVSDEDRQVIANISKIMDFLLGGNASRMLSSGSPQLLRGLAPVLPNVAEEVIPDLVRRLTSRIAARAIRELFI